MRKLIGLTSRARSSRARSRRGLRLAFCFSGVWAILPSVLGQRVIVINTSPSVAPGLYLRSAAKPAVGQIVDFLIPSVARPYVLERTGQEGRTWYILKPIAAGSGDHVDTTGPSLVINGAGSGNVSPGNGLNLTVTGGVAPIQFFLLQNLSGGSIGLYSGAYTAGPNSGTTDIIYVTDATNDIAVQTISVH